MNYEEFKDKIYNELLNAVEPNVTVEQRTVNKNNGVILDGITICSKGENILPCLYLNHFYEQYEQGASVAKIIEDMLNIVNESKGITEQGLISATRTFMNFDEVRDKISFKLVNAEMNKELLKEVLHRLFLDLAIVYFVVCKIDDDGIGTVLVRNSMVCEWNCSLDELHEIAVENTMRLFPAQIRSMEDVIVGLMGREENVCSEEKESPKMYIVTNTRGIQGAATVLYPNLLKGFCKDFSEEGLIILPSSIHEQILLKYTSDMNVGGLENMVREVNSTQVTKEQVLSDKVYFYDPKTDSFEFLSVKQSIPS